jgi:molybdate transport system substrate-binding protein
MKTSVKILATGFATLVFLAQAAIASAAEIKVLSALGMQEIMDDLGPKFERASGHKLAITFGTLGAVVKRVQGGETADVVIIPRQGIDTLVAGGKVAAGDSTVVARSGIVVVVRTGAPKPDVSSPEALKRTLLAARSVTYSDPADGGASAIHFAKVLDRLGIADDMKAKTIYAKGGGDTAVLVANGTAEIGVGQLQLLMPVAGIDVVGPLPGDLQATTIFTATIMTGARNAAASKALIDFLRTPEAANVIKAKGMEPG